MSVPLVPPGLQGELSDLARSAGGAWGHSGRVGHIVSQMEEGSSADQVAVVEMDLGGKDLCIGAQQGALPPSLTLDPATVNITATQHTQQEQHEVMRAVRVCELCVLCVLSVYSRAFTGDVGAVGQLTTVSIFVSLFVD